MNNTQIQEKSSEKITDQIGRILLIKPQLFGMTPGDITKLTHKRVTEIVSLTYQKK